MLILHVYTASGSEHSTQVETVFMSEMHESK